MGSPSVRLSPEKETYEDEVVGKTSTDHGGHDYSGLTSQPHYYKAANGTDWYEF